MKKIILILFFACRALTGNSQEYLKVLKPSDSSLPFKEIAKKINHYFDTLTVSNNAEENDGEEEHEPANAQWKRFEWFAMQHLSPNGKLENYGMKNYDAVNTLSVSSNSDQALLINGGQWQNIGHNFAINEPLRAVQGRVNCIAFHPTNQDIIYIGTAGGGIWKSSFGGQFGSWTNITDNLPVTSFSGIAVAPNGSTIYALTGDGNNGTLEGSIAIHNGIGVLKSDDEGSSWYLTSLNSTPSQGKLGFKIKMHPANSNTVLAALSDGLYRTTDAGNQWNRIARVGTVAVTDFEFKPNDNNVLYYTVMGSNRVYKLNLTTLDTSSTQLPLYVNADRIELGVAPANPESVFALAGPTNLSYNGWFYNGLYYSNDGGSTFTRKNDNLDIFGNNQQADYDIAIHINPSNINELLIAGVRTYRSTNGGTGFIELNTTTATNLKADVHAIERNPLNGYLYMGDDGGVYRSTDNGITWSNMSLNLAISEFYRICGYQGNNDLIIGGAQDNGQFLRPSNTASFNNVIPGYDGMDNIIDYTNSNIMYACIQNGGLRKSTDGGANFSNVAGPTGGIWITPILQSTSNSNTIFYGSTTGILRSANGGSSWTNIGGFNSAVALAISRFGGRLVATDGSKIRVCDNPNDATPIWGTAVNPTGLMNIAEISSLAINLGNANDIYVTASGYDSDFKVFRSIDGGVSYSNVRLNLPNVPVYSVAFENTLQSLNGGVYIGTEIGVFYKNDASAGWEPFYNGLPRVPVTDLFVNLTTNDVTAATFGRGLWRTTGHGQCLSSYNLTNAANPVYGNTFYQASSSISSNQNIQGSSGNSLKLRAGNTITLTNGFRANYGSYFQAINAPCGSAVPLPANRTQKKFSKNRVRKKIN